MAGAQREVGALAHHVHLGQLGQQLREQCRGIGPALLGGGEARPHGGGARVVRGRVAQRVFLQQHGPGLQAGRVGADAVGEADAVHRHVVAPQHQTGRRGRRRLRLARQPRLQPRLQRRAAPQHAVDDHAEQLDVDLQLARHRQPLHVGLGGLDLGQRLGHAPGPQVAEGVHQAQLAAHRQRPVAQARQHAGHVARHQRLHAGDGAPVDRRRALPPAHQRLAALQDVEQRAVQRRQLQVLAAAEVLRAVGQQRQRARGGRQRRPLRVQRRDQRLGLAVAVQRVQRARQRRLRQVQLGGVAAAPGAGDGLLAPARHVHPLPAQARRGGGQPLRARAALRRRHLLHQAQHLAGTAFQEQRIGGLAQRRLGGRPVLRPQQVAHAAQRVGLAGGGAAQQHRQFAGQALLQPQQQRVAEQVVQHQRALLRVERRDEEAAALDLVEPLGGAPVAADGRGARRRQFGQHGGAQQEVVQRLGHLGQHLGGEVVEQVAVDQRVARGRHAAARAQRRQRQPQPGGPAGGALEQLGRALGRLRQGLGGEQRRGLVAAEAQVVLVELGQLAGRAQPCQRQRRRGAAGQHQRPARRQALDQQVQQREHGRLLHAVQVVQHDGAARGLAVGQRVQQLGGGTLQAAGVAAAGQRHQRLGRGAPGQVVRLQRRHQAREHALGVVVAVQRHPGRGQARSLLLGQRQLCCQRRGLAEAGRRLQQHHAVRLQRARDGTVELRALDPRHALARRLDLGAGKAQGFHGWARA